MAGSIKQEKLEDETGDEAEDEMGDEAEDEMPALGGIDWVSRWLACTPHKPYVDVQAEDAASTFTFFSSDLSVGESVEFEAGSGRLN